jgi:hypothetical protein
VGQRVCGLAVCHAILAAEIEHSDDPCYLLYPSVYSRTGVVEGATSRWLFGLHCLSVQNEFLRKRPQPIFVCKTFFVREGKGMKTVIKNWLL